MLKKGDKIPDVQLLNSKNESVNLRDYIGKPLVIFFYPKDNTQGCTAQACGFRDHYDEFLAYDASIIGISKDTPGSHEKVISKRKLPYPLLTDQKGKVLKAFGVSTYLFGAISARCTFIVDKEGVIQYSFREDIQIGKHITKSLKMLEKLN
ncbi:MAG: peroxiredoxin [Bacteroidota bacterium]